MGHWQVIGSVAIAVILAACTSAGSSTNNAAGLKAAAEKLAHALDVGDGKTYYSFLGRKCARRISQKTLSEGMQQAARQRPGPARYKVTVKNVHDGRGEADVTLAAVGSLPAGTEIASFVFTDGRWRLTDDACGIPLISPPTPCVFGAYAAGTSTPPLPLCPVTPGLKAPQRSTAPPHAPGP